MAPSPLLSAAAALAALFATLGPSLGCFDYIVSFGDSLTDTGNYLATRPSGSIGHPPYGETYFHRPTGRFSDGRIILDFLAEAMGLPHVPPYLGAGEFAQGVNFAVGGATAVEASFFLDKGIPMVTNYSLGVQLACFKRFMPSLCSRNNSDCRLKMKKTLFFVGEIGGNDYNIPFGNGIELQEIKTDHVPRVIRAIRKAIHELVEMGAETLVVPSYLPVGCLPSFLTMFKSSVEKDYDPRTGCIKWLNEFAEYYDRKLVEVLDRSRRRHPSATIVYANYYTAMMNIYQNPTHFGFEKKHMLLACCGGSGAYNYDKSVECGTEIANVCSDPSKYACFDGMHLTEAAYRAIAEQLVHGPLAIPAIHRACRGGPQSH